MSTKVITRLLTTLLLGLAVACDTPEAEIRVTRQERELADTLFRAQLDTLLAFIDSACNQIFITEIDNAIDSIYQVRKKEEAELRQRALQ
jgi:hypothetical protein